MMTDDIIDSLKRIDDSYKTLEVSLTQCRAETPEAEKFRADVTEAAQKARRDISGFLATA